MGEGAVFFWSVKGTAVYLEKGRFLLCDKEGGRCACPVYFVLFLLGGAWAGLGGGG